MYFILYLTFTNVMFECMAQLSSIDIACKELLCDIACPYGNVLDARGCITCECIDPCRNYICGQDEICQVEPIVCPKGDCGYTAICVSICPLIRCAAYCPYGNELDENGCDTCTCIDHCKCHRCPRGQVCIAEEVCPGDPCGIRVKCVKRCPTLVCHQYTKCAYGFELDCDNCPTCKCLDPCNSYICLQYSFCTVNIFCNAVPCPPPRAVCKPYCPNGSPFIGSDGLPVQCSQVGALCPRGYVCNNISDLGTSYCCSMFKVAES